MKKKMTLRDNLLNTKEAFRAIHPIVLNHK